MKKYSRKRLARAIPHLLERHPRTQVIKLIATELVKNRSAHELPWLMREVAIALFAATGTLNVDITVARPLSASSQKAIEKLLTEVTGATNIHARTEVAPGLVGGFNAQTPTLEVDASLKKTLTSLTHYA